MVQLPRTFTPGSIGTPGFNPFNDRRGGRRPNWRNFRPLTPWRPSVPMFPRPDVNPKVPFGRRPPKVYPSPSFPGGQPGRWLGPAAMAAIFAAGWLFQRGGYAMPEGWSLCFDFGGPKQGMAGPTFAWCGPDFWGNLGYQVPSGNYGDPVQITDKFHTDFWFGPWEIGLEGQRMKYTEGWHRNLPTGAEWNGPYEIPFTAPLSIPMLPLLPWEWPLPAPLYNPLPIAPPIRPGSQPRPRPWPNPRPRPNSEPATLPQPALPLGIVPAVTLTPDPFRPIVPDVHIKEPPDDRTREKKKRIKGHRAYKWGEILEYFASNFMELDDMVSALYKAIPWKYRRWRGRDGVWRDRAYMTQQRLTQIYKYLGEVNINKALDFAWDGIHNVAMNELQDRFYGAIGNALKNRAKELGEEGLWAGNGGFQRGSSGMRKEQWEAYKKAKREEFARTYKAQYYFKTRYVEGNGWVRERHLRPITQIPWYRQRSNYPYHFTQPGTGGNAGSVRPRTYYAPRDEGPRKPWDWPTVRGYT